LVTYVAEHYGWTKGFYLSSGGMLFGLIVFLIGNPHYNNDADGFQRHNLAKSSLGIPNLIWIILGTIILGVTMVYLFRHSGQTKLVITYLSIAIIVGILLLAFSCQDKKERNSIFAILIVIVSAICYQSFGKQMYNSLTLFVDRDFITVLFGIKVASSFFALV